MKEAVWIRNVELGAGKPKICVPLTGETVQELEKEAKEAVCHPIDLVEWRADRFDELQIPGRPEKMAECLREILGDIPLLFTCRTEDGQFSIDVDSYVELNKRMISSGWLDLIDVELFMGDGVCREVVEYAHAHQVAVIISNHEFKRTPDVDVMVQRLQAMRYLGADIPKLAVMPANTGDLLKLLRATDTYNGWFADGPIITMSMGKTGVLSRICGETFGSALTFAAVGKASAPGQISVEEVKQVLDILHQQ